MQNILKKVESTGWYFSKCGSAASSIFGPFSDLNIRIDSQVKNSSGEVGRFLNFGMVLEKFRFVAEIWVKNAKVIIGHSKPTVRRTSTVRHSHYRY